MVFEPTDRYDDIIDEPHHVSARHPPMPRRNRAAQFMPFAALTGYETQLERMERAVESGYDDAVPALGAEAAESGPVESEAVMKALADGLIAGDLMADGMAFRAGIDADGENDDAVSPSDVHNGSVGGR